MIHADDFGMSGPAWPAPRRSFEAPEKGKTADEVKTLKARFKPRREEGSTSRRIRLVYDAEANVYIVEVRDTRSDKVIRQLPPEDLVRWRKHVGQTAGNLIDRQA